MAFPDNPNIRGPRDPRDPQNRLGPSPAANPPYRLTREELQVIKQCNQESFYGRCVPLMAALGLGAYYGVHMGFLKGNVKYGATPKVVLGLIVGFVTGKLSYKDKCEEKILALPGGRLKEAILMRRKAKDGILSSFDEGLYNDASLSYAMPYVGSTFQGEAKSIAELDTDRPYDSFDDSFRSNSELYNENESLPIPPPSRSVTYDELRQNNRAEFESRRKMYRSGPLDDYAPYGSAVAPPPVASRDDERTFARIPPPPPPSSGQSIQSPPEQPTFYTSSQPRLSPQRKNLYGDVVEK